MPPAAHFRLAESGQRPIKAGDFDFPRLNDPPLKTTKEREPRFPLFGIFPRLFCRKVTGGRALLRNGPAARPQEAAVTFPPQGGRWLAAGQTDEGARRTVSHPVTTGAPRCPHEILTRNQKRTPQLRRPFLTIWVIPRQRRRSGGTARHDGRRCRCARCGSSSGGTWEPRTV